MEDLVLASADDHIVEPADMYAKHLSPEHLSLAPRYVQENDLGGYWFWEHEGKKSYNVGLNAVVGRPREEYGFEPTGLDQMRRGTYDVHARIDDMDVSGLLCSLNYPTMTGFDGAYFWDAKDKPNALRVLRAYNDWHVDEWCGAYPGRLIPNGLVPAWDSADTVAEIKRLVAKGCRSITFPANPASKGLPSIHDESWEPVWKICNDERVIINIHIGTGVTPAHASALSPITAWMHTMPMALSVDASDWLHNRALLRYPDLKIAMPEGGIGWIPYFLERGDFVFSHQGAWARADFGGKLPSQVFREHFLVCFIDDRFGCKNLDDIGVETVMYEADYPHSDCTWPDTASELWRGLKDLPDATIDKITHENFFREFQIDPFPMLGGRENCTVGALQAKARARGVSTAVESFGGQDARGFGDPSKPVTSQDVWATHRNSKGVAPIEHSPEAMAE
ncbi:MAG: amidohydrolase family protein [Sphingobium sp.]